MTAEQIRNGIRKLFEDYQSGRISFEEFNRESIIDIKAYARHVAELDREKAYPVGEGHDMCSCEYPDEIETP